MRQYVSTAIALSILLIAAGCSSNSQTANSQTSQQHPACVPGDQYPQCMQMAQTKTPGAAPYGLQSTGPTNPDMRDYDTSYPRNPAVRLVTPGISGMPWGAGFIR